MKIFTVRYNYFNRSRWFIKGEMTVEARSQEDAERIVTKRYSSPWVENFYIVSVWTPSVCAVRSA